MAIAALTALLAVLAFGVAERFRRSAGPSGGELPERPALQAWNLLGCYRLRVEAWQPSVEGGPAAGRIDIASGELPASLAPPTAVLLLPDSVDRWGNELDSRRAVPIGRGGDGDALEGRDPAPDPSAPAEPEGSEARGRFVHWLARADTLWVLWADGEARGGVALFASGDSLLGRARAVLGEAFDVTAPARAWRINCATLARERIRRVPRR